MNEEFKYPCRISVCPSGCVHIHLGCTTVHMNQNDFLEFSAKVMNVARDMTAASREASPTTRLLGKGWRLFTNTERS